VYILPQQWIASVLAAICLLILIVRLIQKGKLDIAYAWIWLGIGLGALLAVLRYEWLAALSELIGAVTVTTTLFLLGFFVVLLLCLQFSWVTSTHRRQIKRLIQQVAMLETRITPGIPPADGSPLPPAHSREDTAGPAPAASGAPGSGTLPRGEPLT